MRRIFEKGGCAGVVWLTVDSDLHDTKHKQLIAKV